MKTRSTFDSNGQHCGFVNVSELCYAEVAGIRGGFVIMGQTSGNSFWLSPLLPDRETAMTELAKLEQYCRNDD